MLARRVGEFTPQRLADIAELFHISRREFKDEVIGRNPLPADPDRATAVDADRVFPGDGIAPLGQILRDLQGAGYNGMLSLELFNKSYWAQDARLVARTGLAKMQQAVQAALGG